MCIDDEEELEMFHADDPPDYWWDYEIHLNLQLNYDDDDMEGRYEVITEEVYDAHSSVAHGNCLIRDL